MKKNALYVLGFCFCCLFALSCSKSSDPTPNGGGGNNGGSGGTNGGGGSTVTAPNTYFIAFQDYTVSNFGAYLTNQFTVSATTTFVFRFTSEYKSQAAIISSSQLSNFTGMQAFSGYGLFDAQVGTQTVTLGPGTYYVAVRNTNSGANDWSAELDYNITLPASDNCTYYDTYLNTSNSYASGAKIWQAFTIQSGYRYFIDGCNVGFSVYFIDASQLTAFQNNTTFNYYSSYTNFSGADPGLVELTLPPGNYYIAGSSSGASSITYRMERWKIN